MEKIGLPVSATEKKLDVKYFNEDDLKKVLEDFKAVEKQLEVSMGRADAYIAKIKNVKYSTVKFDFEEEESCRYDVVVFRKNKDGSETLIATTPAYKSSEPAEKIYNYLQDLYRSRLGWKK